MKYGDDPKWYLNMIRFFQPKRGISKRWLVYSFVENCRRIIGRCKIKLHHSAKWLTWFINKKRLSYKRTDKRTKTIRKIQTLKNIIEEVGEEGRSPDITGLQSCVFATATFKNCFILKIEKLTLQIVFSVWLNYDPRKIYERSTQHC